jgi:hypothetical protein
LLIKKKKKKKTKQSGESFNMVLDETGCKWRYLLDMPLTFLWLRIIMILFPAGSTKQTPSSSYRNVTLSRHAWISWNIAHLELLNDHWLKDLYEPLNKRQLELPTVAFYLLIEMVFVFIIIAGIQDHFNIDPKLEHCFQRWTDILCLLGLTPLTYLSAFCKSKNLCWLGIRIMFLSVSLHPWNPTKRVGLVQSRHHHPLIEM